jgi:hypothetical protein
VPSAEREPAPAGQPPAGPAPNKPATQNASAAKRRAAKSAPAGSGPVAGAQATPAGVQPTGAGDEPDRYRSMVAVIFFWIWTAFAAANLVDLAVEGHDRFGATIAAVLLLVTGVVYTTSLRPLVVAGHDGIKIVNPVRDHYVPWGAVDEVDLADSLKLKISWNDGITEHRKNLYAWAVHSPRRGRLKSQMRAKRQERRPQRPAPAIQLSPEAKQSLKKTDAEYMTRAVEERAALAHAEGMMGGLPTSAWNWPAIAAIVLPAVLMIIVILV